VFCIFLFHTRNTGRSQERRIRKEKERKKKRRKRREEGKKKGREGKGKRKRKKRERKSGQSNKYIIKVTHPRWVTFCEGFRTAAVGHLRVGHLWVTCLLI
jgi:hypothetical protein